MLFDDEKVSELVYIHEFKRDFKIGDFLYISEDFYVPKLEFYKAPKHISSTRKSNWGDYVINEYGNLKRENVLLPKGLILSVDNILDNKLRDDFFSDNRLICFKCLKKYNTSLKDGDLEILANKFKIRTSDLNGLQFHRIGNVDTFIRKRKIQILLG